MSDIPDYEPEPMARGLVIGCLLSVGLVVAIIIWTSWMPGWEADERMQLQSGLAFPELDIDSDELAAVRAEFAGETNLELLDEEIERLHQTVRETNRAQFDRGITEFDEANEQARQKLQFWSNDVVTATGPRGFQQAGNEIFDQCQQGLEDLLSEVQSENLPVDQALDDPPADRFGQYRENCGNFLPILQQRGLVDSDGLWTRASAPELSQILQRYRWVQELMGEKYSIYMMMSPQELELFYRWRIEDAEAFEPDQRRAYLHSALPLLPDDYDVPLAEARIDISAKDSTLDRQQRFQQLLDDYPENELYQAIYDDAF